MKSMQILKSTIAVLILFTFIYMCSAQDSTLVSKKDTQGIVSQPVEEELSTPESVSGEVALIDKDHISIIYKRDYDTETEYEIVIPVVKDTVIKHKVSLSEIKKGDMVAVDYLKSSKGKLKAKTIIFVQENIDSLLSNDNNGLYGDSAQN